MKKLYTNIIFCATKIPGNCFFKVFNRLKNVNLSFEYMAQILLVISKNLCPISSLSLSLFFFKGLVIFYMSGLLFASWHLILISIEINFASYTVPINPKLYPSRPLYFLRLVCLNFHSPGQKLRSNVPPNVFLKAKSATMTFYTLTKL